MRQSHRRSPVTVTLTAITTAVVLSASARVGAQSASAPAGLKYLPPASVHGVVKGNAVFTVFDELRTLFAEHKILGRPVMGLVEAQLTALLGFDPTRAANFERLGIDLSEPVVVSLSSYDAKALGACNRHLQQVVGHAFMSKAPWRERLKGQNPGDRATGYLADAPPALLGHRAVLRLKERDVLVAWLKEQQKKGGRLVVLEEAGGQGADAFAPVFSLSAADAQKVAAELKSAQVLAVARPERSLLLALRVVDGYLIVDAATPWYQVPRSGDDRKLAEAFKALLVLPRKPALDVGRDTLAAKLAVTDASATFLVGARPLSALAELSVQRRAALEVVGLSPEESRRQHKTQQADRNKARALWAKTGLTGDVALQFRLSRRAWHARAWWRLPAAAVTALGRGLAKEDLIDPTAYASSAVALAGTNLDLSQVAKTVGKGPFALGLDKFAQSAARVSEVAMSSLLLGSWVGLLGVMRAELAGDAALGPLTGGLRNAAALLKTMPYVWPAASGTRRVFPPSLLGYAVVDQKESKRVKDKVKELATRTYPQPQNLTHGGRKTILYNNLTGALQTYALAVTELGKGALGLTLATRSWEVPWFLQQPAPKETILPRQILFFAHGDMGAVAAGLARMADGAEKDLLARLAQRAGKLGANVAVDGKLLSVQANLDLR
ncbi:MAG: hypothetical protein IT371_11490 [Deltaproteobacteria bacterium]|nr:hypothetical protein [Deltaproteobacteria bacterium]